ncbi:hypothetical protein [Stenotrophomonas sp. SORGH_AS_0321]|uniref:hypothetical protein n=1 Tax=Stenotrophomonas sp. SORGH_AS_0321 TaxID=3041787 RepID=UPI002865B144|nr:hypothetical protein [Stenotrophomonas sp. SORGH_AS_0321]MDR6094944.1 hypothetical protein [Stenotrophomonas sp. SORGH_AS_0321]
MSDLERFALKALVAAGHVEQSKVDEAIAIGAAAGTRQVGAVQEPVLFAVESKAFEAHAASRKLNLDQHPLHYLFLDRVTDEARHAWKAALLFSPPARAVDPQDPWRGLYSPHLMPTLDGVNLYHVAHPDLPSWPKNEDEERGIGPLITAQGFAVEVVFGEYPEDEGEEVDYCAWLASWTPEAPAGDHWRLVGIQDTEDGPAAFFVRPLALIDGGKAVQS